MEIKNKKGWLRIVEAVLAILIVAVALLFIRTNSLVQQNTSSDIYEIERNILELISKNDTLRAEVLRGELTNTKEFTSKMLSENWNHNLRICDLDVICGNEETIIDREVYSSEILIVANPETYNPKKLKIFVWAK